MSDIDICPPTTSERIFEKQPQLQQTNIAEQVINNSVFRMMLKDIIEELFDKKAQQQQQDHQEDEPKVGVQSFIEEISDSLMLIAQNQANKKIKEAEKFLNQMYEHKVKEIKDKFQMMIEDKLKEVDEKIKQIQQRTRSDKNQSCFLSPVRPVLKSKQLIESSFCQQINKRMELKQKLLNSSILPEQRSNMQIQSMSMIPEAINEPIFPQTDKLSQKIKAIEQNFKQQMKAITQKITLIRSQCKTDLQDSQSNVKQQLNSGFEGIWNVISNLEKRMMSLS